MKASSIQSNFTPYYTKSDSISEYSNDRIVQDCSKINTGKSNREMFYMNYL